MANLLLVDDTTALTDLFAEAIRARLGHSVATVNRLRDVGSALVAHGPFDLALVDLSFPYDDGSGLDALAEIHTDAPGTTLAVLTQGDEWVAQVLRDAWELLPIATVVSKTAPLQYQLDAIERVLRTGRAPVDPAIQPLVPASKSPLRSIERFSELVQHAGHAKLWRALIAGSATPTYKEVAAEAGLRLNTVKNYRAQLLGELVLHGLQDPGLSEMRDFAIRCRPFLAPYISQALAVVSARRVRDGLIALVIGFGATTAAFAAGELRSTSAAALGDLDVYKYCSRRFGDDSVAALLAWNAYGWQCTSGRRILMYHKPDFDDACRLQYGVDEAEAHTDDEAWPFSWRCFAP